MTDKFLEVSWREDETLSTEYNGVIKVDAVAFDAADEDEREQMVWDALTEQNTFDSKGNTNYERTTGHGEVDDKEILDVTEVDGPDEAEVKTSDTDALDQIHALLTGNEWDTSQLEAIAEILRATNRVVADVGV